MKKFVVAGLLVWLPLAVTVWVLAWLVGLMDGIFGWLLTGVAAVLPASAQAAVERLRDWPGLGVVVMLAVLLLTGVFATNYFGQWWLRQWDRLVGKIPIVKSIYSSVKQVADTLFSSSGNATIAFVTGRPGGEVAEHLQGDYLSIYVPTTPNPTSGFFLMLPRADVIELDMTVDAALKYIVSMGVVAPAAPGLAPQLPVVRNPVG